MPSTRTNTQKEAPTTFTPTQARRQRGPPRILHRAQDSTSTMLAARTSLDPSGHSASCSGVALLSNDVHSGVDASFIFFLNTKKTMLSLMVQITKLSEGLNARMSSMDPAMATPALHRACGTQLRLTTQRLWHTTPAHYTEAVAHHPS